MESKAGSAPKGKSTNKTTKAPATASTDAAPAKRRGRPAKTMASPEASVATIGVLKRRGRPSKKGVHLPESAGLINEDTYVKEDMLSSIFDKRNESMENE